MVGRKVHVSPFGCEWASGELVKLHRAATMGVGVNVEGSELSPHRGAWKGMPPHGRYSHIWPRSPTPRNTPRESRSIDRSSKNLGTKVSHRVKALQPWDRTDSCESVNRCTFYAIRSVAKYSDEDADESKPCWSHFAELKKRVTESHSLNTVPFVRMPGY